METKNHTDAGSVACRVYLAVDSSGSMAGARIGSVNALGRELVADLRDLAEGPPEIQVDLQVLSFGSECTWMSSSPSASAPIRWRDITEAKGKTCLGAALELISKDVAERHAVSQVVTVLVTDGAPTDNWVDGLAKLDDLEISPETVRIAAAIGDDADWRVLHAFVANGDDQHSTVVRYSDELCDAVTAAIRHVLKRSRT